MRPSCKRGGRVPPRRRRQDGGVRGAGMSEVAARGRVAEQVQLFGEPPRGRGRREPNRGLERGVVSLLRARPEECSSGDGATHLHLELGRRCDCLRLGRSESGLNLSLCPFHSTRDQKHKQKAPPKPGEMGCVSATRAEAVLGASFSGSRVAGRGGKMWEEHWSGSWAAFTSDSWSLK